MLSNTDKSNLLKMLKETAVYYQRNLSETTLAMYLNGLDGYPLADIAHGIQAHMTDRQHGHFMPMINQIIAKIEDCKPTLANPATTHPAPNEAWAIALQCADEYESVAVSTEIMEAWGIARTVFDAGDEVGARMAFLDAYRRIVATKPVPTWFLSPGFDLQRRMLAQEAGVKCGRLPAPSAETRLLPSPGDGLSIAGLAEAAKKSNHEKTAEAFDGLRAVLVTKDDGTTAFEAGRETKRMTFERHRQAELDRLAALEANPQRAAA